MAVGLTVQMLRHFLFIIKMIEARSETCGTFCSCVVRQTDGIFKKKEEKEKKKKKYLNEREEEESKRDTIRRPPPFLFADTIKSRLHLITTRGDVTNGLSSSRKGRLLFFFFFIYLTSEARGGEGMRDGRGDCVIFIYTTRQFASMIRRRVLAFNSHSDNFT